MGLRVKYWFLQMRDGIVVGFLMNGPFSLLPYPFILKLGFANGQIIAFDRNSYFSIGGYAAVRGEVLEDVALGLKIRSYKLFLGVGIAKTRMYRGYKEAGIPAVLERVCSFGT